MRADTVPQPGGVTGTEGDAAALSAPPLPEAHRHDVAMEAGRIGFVDNAKAIGIVLVVLGHASGTPESLTTLIYGFHMPLFFFLSGFLLTANRFNGSFFAQIGKQARSLLLPYFIFFAASYLYWLGTRNLGARAAKFQGVSWSDPLIGMLSGLGDRMIVNPALWFLPCLFTSLLLYLLIRRVLNATAALILLTPLALLAMAGMEGFGIRLPWGLDNGWVAIVFIAAGCLWRERSARESVGSRAALLAGAALFAGLFLFALSYIGRVDLNMAHFGPSPFLYFAAAFCGIAASVATSMALPPNALTCWLARNTLIIFPTHPLVMNFASGLAKLVFKAPDALLQSPVWAVASSLAGIAAAVPIGKALRFAFPQTFR